MADPRDRDIRLRGKLCRLRFVPQDRLNDACEDRLDGVCLRRKKPLILILETLQGIDLLETLIHELLHECCWDLCEHAVHATARDIARAIRPNLEQIVDDLT
jgi:hypothetical protein